MNRIVRLASAALLLCLLCGCGAGYRLLRGPVPEGLPTPPPVGEGWVNLLQAEHIALWRNVTDDADIFSITEDGMLHIYGRSVRPLRYIGYTGEDFGDFELHLEFRLAPRANSGVFLRSNPQDPVNRGFEVQVLEDHGAPPNKHGCGAIYDVATPMFNMSRPAGEWNSFDIQVVGQEVIVFMNGWRVIHTDFSQMTMPIGKFEQPYADMPLSGMLMLQDHGGEAWFRNIYIRKL